MNHRTEILDLRTALQVLRETPGQLVETNVEVDPAAELSGVYRYVGAGGTVMRPTQVDGPAMVFHNVKGHPGASVAIGVLASREREVDIRISCPEKAAPFAREIEKTVAQIITRNGLTAKEVSVRKMERPVALTEVFPKIFEGKNSVNVKV